MIYILLVGLGVAVIAFGLITGRRKHSYFEEYNQTVRVYSMADADSALDFESLSGLTNKQKLSRWFSNLKRQIGSLALVKLTAFYALLLIAGSEINQRFVRADLLLVEIIVVIAGTYLGINWLHKRAEKEFESAFPDALNILSSAVSAGESIMHAIIYVGKTLDGTVGAEFKRMGERLQMGESPDEVLKKSVERFPYPSFQFFVIVIRANLSRGGQLKDVINRLNRVMAGAKSLENKKYALTAEARTSAKIVGAIPFIFLLLLQYIAPVNYEYVMFDPGGRPILYYVLISEAIGIAIVWGLMKGVK